MMKSPNDSGSKPSERAKPWVVRSSAKFGSCGAASVMALVNVIMFAGAARAAATTNAPDNSDSQAPARKAAAKAPASKPASTTAAAKAAPDSTSNGITNLAPIVVQGERGPYQATQASLPLYTEPLIDTPQTIQIVPQQLIRDQQATTLRDVLSNVPGISFQAGEGNSTVAGDNLSIRGFNARDDIFVDGIRDDGIYTRDPYNLEQVEVVKGPASAYEGYGETGGSINLVTKAPQLAPDYEFSGGVGTNSYNRETLDVNQPFSVLGDSTLAFRLNAFQQYNEEADRNYVYNSRWGAAPSIAWGLGTDTRVQLSYQHLREDDLPDYGFPFVNAAAIHVGDFGSGALNHVANLPYSNFYGLYNRDHETSINDMPTLTFEHDFDHSVRLINQTRYDRTAFNAINTSARFDTTPPLLPGEITRETNARNDVDQLFDNKTYVSIPFELVVPNDLVTSLELSRETDVFKTGAGPNVDTGLSDPNVFTPYDGTITYTDPRTNQLDDVAWSLFDTIKFTPQWELTGGMRYDHLNSSYLDRGPATPSEFARTDDLASWRLALVYKPLPNGSVYAGYGTSYNPSIQGVSDGASNDALTANTANLPPENDISYEIGTKWNLLNEKLTLTGALFRTDKTNARVVDPTLPGTVYALGGKERVQGVEVDVAGSLTDAWKVFGGYVYMQSEQLTGPRSAYPGNTLPNTPDQSASLWTTYDLPWHLTVGTGAQFVDKRYSLVSDVNSSPGYWTQQAMISYGITRNVTMQLNVSNLWDERYIALVGAHQAVPGVGRTIIFSTSFKF